jgi:hypothetical protein
VPKGLIGSFVARILILFYRLSTKNDHLLDLHGLTVNEAETLVREGLTQWWSRSQIQIGNICSRYIYELANDPLLSSLYKLDERYSPCKSLLALEIILNVAKLGYYQVSKGCYEMKAGSSM